ncbi:YgaP family membrane protein [Haloferax volcanii]|uniref:YgaP family membrane protein n=1 Tax=Haloferax volcanii TaxID=2246 RepID=UPI003851E125
MEKNVGGYDRIARAILGPVLIVVGAASLAGFLTIAAGTLGLVIAVAALLVGAVLATTAVTQKCPLNDLLGVDTYEGATATETESAGKPRAQ